MGVLAVSAWDCMMQSPPVIGQQAEYWPLIGWTLSLITMAMNPGQNLMVFEYNVQLDLQSIESSLAYIDSL